MVPFGISAKLTFSSKLPKIKSFSLRTCLLVLGLFIGTQVGACTLPVSTSTAEPRGTSFLPFLSTAGPNIALSAIEVSNGSSPVCSSVGDSGM